MWRRASSIESPRQSASGRPVPQIALGRLCGVVPGCVPAATGLGDELGECRLGELKRGVASCVRLGEVDFDLLRLLRNPRRSEDGGGEQGDGGGLHRSGYLWGRELADTRLKMPCLGGCCCTTQGRTRGRRFNSAAGLVGNEAVHGRNRERGAGAGAGNSNRTRQIAKTQGSRAAIAEGYTLRRPGSVPGFRAEVHDFGPGISIPLLWRLHRLRWFV